MAPITGRDYGTKIRDELCSGAMWRDVVAEFVGTFLLVFTQLVILQNWQSAEHTNPQALAVQVGLAMAFIVASVGYALGDFGGANFNPAVTLALVMRAEMTVIKGLMYWISQLTAGIVSAFFVLAVTPREQIMTSKLGNTYLGTDVAWWQGVLIEMIITMMLCITALATGNAKRKGQIILPSIPVGFALGLGLLLAIHSTGASMNPARSLGPCIVSSTVGINDCWSHHYVYWVGPFIGAALAAIFYWIFDSVRDPKPKQKEEFLLQPNQVYAATNYLQPTVVTPQNVTTIAIPSEGVIPYTNSAYYPY